MMIRSGIMILLCCCLTAMTVYAQPAIKGSVLDERKTALTGATILLRQAADSQVVLTTISDSAGYFRFPKVNPGKYLLQVSFITYLTTTIPLRVESQPLPPIEIILRPDQQSLQGVTVRGRKPGITVTAGKTTMNVESSPLAQSQSAFDLLKDLPGVTITKEGEIKIRGRSGVTVMIDGEPVEMGSTQLKNMLSATPGSTLQAMEVLNNPPSSMDAAGNGGVINIKFKKRTQKGFNGNIASGIGWGRYFKTDHSITLSKGTDQWNLNGTYAIDIDRMWQRDSIHRPVTASGNPFTMQQVLLSPQRTTSHLAKLSVDRYLGKQHTIGLTLTYNQFTNPINGTANTRFFEKPSVIDSLLYQQNNIRNTYTNLDGILKYRFKISDHHAFSTSFQATRLETKGREEFNVQTILPGAGTRPAFRYRNIYPGTVDRYSFRADYTQDYVPIGAKSGKFEMGIKATQANTRNSQEAANMIRDKWEADISRNNRFRYRERILAAYTSMEVTWPQWELKGGLRGEQTGISGDSLNGPRLVKQNYLSLFPNLQVGYKFSDHYKLSVSYNRRIDRPEYDKLNPAVRYLDLYTIETGNPYLKPQFSDNFELSQQLFDFIDITAGYSLIKNPLYYTFIPSQGSQEAKYTTINAGKQRQWSAALSFPIPLAKWWENYQTFYFYSSRFNANLDNQVFREKANSFGMSTYNSFQLPAGFSMELNGWYESGGLYGNFLYKPMAELSLGLNKKFFNDKLSAGIAVNDVFYTSMFRANMINKREGNSYLDSRTDSRIVKLTLNWRFGKKPATAADKKVDETDADRLPDGRSKQAIKKPGMQ